MGQLAFVIHQNILRYEGTVRALKYILFASDAYILQII